MAHLVKLEDYVSRYENDIQRYPSQFTRLKKERWDRLQKIWSDVNRSSSFPEEEDWFADVDKSFFQHAKDRITGMYKHRLCRDENHPSIDPRYQHLIGKSRESLRAFFYYELLQTQLKWASSSFLEESFVDSKYRYDSCLRDLLQQFPDNYMLFYYPVFNIRQADVQLDILLLSPSEIYCMTFVETPPHTLLKANSKHFWLEFRGEREHKRLSPLLSIKRMENVVRSIFRSKEIHFPIKRVVLALDAIIDDFDYAGLVAMVDQRNYENWIDHARRHSSPMKKGQFQAADALLRHGKTQAFKRAPAIDGTDEVEGQDLSGY